ncbi:MAG TPA: hypothetical protein VJ691_00230 [Vicinamibacterales bacterium]|nr:hypothetical protein [Vicinamibacterales bacterium]
MTRRLVIAFGAAVVALFIVAFVIAAGGSAEREQMNMRHLQNATFASPPPSPGLGEVARTVWSDFFAADDGLRRSTLPTQSGVLWIALLVALTVAFDYSRPSNPRNFELLALVSLGFLLFNVMRFFDLLGNPVYFRVMDLVFTAVVTVSLALVALALWRVRHPHAQAWLPNLPTRALLTLTVVLLTINLGMGLFTPPDDAGFYTNLGAQRLRERGKFPYGDPLLSNSAGAGYGPVLYLAHLPYQFIFNPRPLNETEPTRDDLAAGATYYLPPAIATQLTTATFHLLGVAALVLIGLQLAGPQVAWGLAALYCGSAYVMGVGGGRETIGGMTFISHIAPPSVAMLAYAALSRPMAAGALLVAAAATVFYPVLFVPAWLGYYWDRRSDALRFLAGLTIAGLLIGIPVLMLSQALPGRSVLSTVIHESVGHHQGTDTYGLSTFGFWGQRGGIREWLRQPLLAGEFTTSPMFVLTILPAAAMFFVARRTTPQQLALLTGALGILAQWSKIHGTGVYVNWYYPFFLIGLFAVGGAGRSQKELTNSA